MKNKLYNIPKNLKLPENCQIFGDASKIHGTVSPDLKGNVSRLSGDISNIHGDVSNIRGNMAGISGDVSGISGDISIITGNCTGIVLNLDDLNIDINYLIK